jgi:sucrose-6-phosphate hydrolase SacC (GH32 family)
VEGTGDTKWVLIVAINPGAPLGGSMNEYFIGDFDGTTFTPDDGLARFIEFRTTLVGGNTGRLDINIRNAAGEQVTVGVDWDNNGQVYVERGNTTGFTNRYFTNDFSTQESNLDNSIELHVLVDRSVLEVFVDDGIQVCTTSFFMANGPPTEMQWEATNSPVLVESLEAYTLKSIWPSLRHPFQTSALSRRSKNARKETRSGTHRKDAPLYRGRPCNQERALEQVAPAYFSVRCFKADDASLGLSRLRFNIPRSSK